MRFDVRNKIANSSNCIAVPTLQDFFHHFGVKFADKIFAFLISPYSARQVSSVCLSIYVVACPLTTWRTAVSLGYC
jgi:hypothetical protein